MKKIALGIICCVGLVSFILAGQTTEASDIRLIPSPQLLVEHEPVDELDNKEDLAPEQPQQDAPIAFIAAQPCNDPGTILNDLAQYQEEPLFIGRSNLRHYSGRFYMGDAMFMVNQETGTWTLMTLYPDGTVCVVAAGDRFQPYIAEGRLKTNN